MRSMNSNMIFIIYKKKLELCLYFLIYKVLKQTINERTIQIYSHLKIPE